MTPVPRRLLSGEVRRPNYRLVARRFKQGESVEAIAWDLWLRCWDRTGRAPAKDWETWRGEVEDALRRAMVRGRKGRGR